MNTIRKTLPYFPFVLLYLLLRIPCKAESEVDCGKENIRKISSLNGHYPHDRRQLQLWDFGRFSFRRDFCVPDGAGFFKTQSVIFFRARRFRRRYGADKEGVCTEEKCSTFCGYAPCQVSYAFFSDSESCHCLGGASTPIECGLNAKCSEEFDRCVCNEGFTGDALVECIQSTPAPTPTVASTMSPTLLSSSNPTPRITSKLTSLTTDTNTTCPPCRFGNKCCNGVCIQENQCCVETGDGKQCNDGSCANSIGNFGCCPENIACGDECCPEGLKCCSGKCVTANCCDNPDSCCDSEDPCCGSSDPCCASNDNTASECGPDGTGYGEPHLTTYDGLAYDCQAQGEFILTKSLNSSLEVQARFQRITGLSASITKGLAIRIPSSKTVVQLIVSEEQGSRLRLWVDGIEVSQIAEGYKSDTIEFGQRGLLDYYIFCQDASLYITVLDSPQGRFIDFKINLVGRFRNEMLVGLLGSPDDDPANDWMDGTTGVPLLIPNTRQDLTSTRSNEYCTQNWCLREQTKTLFVHDSVSEFATYRNACDENYPGRPTITDPVLLDLCGNDLDCLLDGYLFGIETARSTVAAQTRYLQSNTNRFRVSPVNLVQGVDKLINVTLDLRNNDFDTSNIDSFGLYVVDESTGERLPNRLATLRRLSTLTSKRSTIASDSIFSGENIDISGLSAFESGNFAGLQACPSDSATVTDDCAVTITGRKAFRALNRFGEGKCFETKGELKIAVKEYLQDNGRDSAVARKYGWPIGIWCVKNIEDFSGLFAYAFNFNESLNSWNVSQATSMKSMFEGASAYNSNISSWDVAGVKDMSYMFKMATSFSIDIRGWNVRNVVNMQEMFYFASDFNVDVSQWELASVMDVRDMFSYASSYQKNLCPWGKWLGEADSRDMFFSAQSCPSQSDPDFSLTVPSPFCYTCSIAASNTSTPTLSPTTIYPITVVPTLSPTTSSRSTIHPATVSPSTKPYAVLHDNTELRAAVDDYLDKNTFASSTYGPVIGEWDVSLVTNFSSIFKTKRTFNERLDAWNVSSATTMNSMFYKAEVFEQSLETWNVAKVTDMSYMFDGAYGQFSGLSGWDVSSLRNASYMFQGAISYGEDLSAWNTSSVIDMQHMFGRALRFKSNLSAWNVASVTDMSYMFHFAEAFQSDLDVWDVSSVTEMNGMFAYAKLFQSSLSAWNVSAVAGMNEMFYFAVTFNGSLSDWDVSSATGMRKMFYGASFFESNLSNWTVSSVADMYGMFFEAGSFQSNLSTWIVSAVSDMSYMFYFADIFQSDINAWDVSSVTNMEGMFLFATRFNYSLCDWGSKLNNVTNVNKMFSASGCPNTSSPDLSLDVPGPFCNPCH